MTDKPIERMKKPELMALIKETYQSIAEINNFKQRIEAIETQINDSKEETSQNMAEINNSKQRIEAMETQINDSKEETSQNMAEINNSKQRIEAMETQINDSKEKAGELSEQMDEQCEKHKEEIAEVESLRKIVRDLLPGATTAGLAGSYIDAQEKRGVGWYWFGFTASLIALICLYGYNLFIEPTSLTWGGLFIRFTTGLPLVWIAWYCQKSISQTRRIKEEYQHKERIMRVYPAFMKQLKEGEEENTDKILDFITTTIKAIAKNPAEVLNPSETLLDSMKGRNKTEQ